VDGDAKSPGDTKLVTPDEGGSVADLPPSSESEGDKQISRVIVPGGPGVDGPAGSDAATPPAGEGADGANPIGPRKVRTVVVRPDGTIVSSEAVPADGSAGAPPATGDGDSAAGATPPGADAAPAAPAPDAGAAP